MTENKTKTALPTLRFAEFEGEWMVKTIEELCEILNNRRKPISGEHRVKGEYPYYGASGIVDHVNEYLFDERLVLVGEDGAKWGAWENTAFIADGKFWVNNHAHVLRPIKVNSTLLENYLTKSDLSPFVTGAAPPKLTLGKLKEILIPVPKIHAEQQKIAATLSSLDELIAAESEKLQALHVHKRGLMQGLFPAEGETVPRLRFAEFEEAGEWEVEVLTGKDVAVFVKEKIPVHELRSGFYVSTENLLPDYAGVVAATKLPASGSFTRFNKGDILVSNIRPYLKKVWLSDVSGAASNDVIIRVVAINKINTNFRYEYFTEPVENRASVAQCHRHG